MASVSIVPMGDSPITVEVPEGATIAEALNAADIQVQSASEVFYQGTPIESLEQVVPDGANLVVAQAVKGG